MSDSPLAKLSIVIPLAANETEQHNLLADLEGCGAEIIPCTDTSRASSLNLGAAKSSGEWLWFLHADSRINPDNIRALEQSLKQFPSALHYFDLAFDLKWLRYNATGANMRSRLFGLPFGDQGLCIKKSLFDTLDGYSEDCPYGEDLLFVWQARLAGIPLQRVPSKLLTSGRKYQQRGWLQLSLLYQWRWMKLSLGPFIKLLSQRVRGLYD